MGTRTSTSTGTLFEGTGWSINEIIALMVVGFDHFAGQRGSVNFANASGLGVSLDEGCLGGDRIVSDRPRIRLPRSVDGRSHNLTELLLCYCPSKCRLLVLGILQHTYRTRVHLSLSLPAACIMEMMHGTAPQIFSPKYSPPSPFSFLGQERERPFTKHLDYPLTHPSTLF